MALALLELTETAAGEVLERLLVTSTAEAAGEPHDAMRGALKRLRVFAQISNELTGVPRSVRLQLDHVALSSIHQLARRRGGLRLRSSSFTALWRHGRLQELHSHSLADSLQLWQRQAGAALDDMLIEISDPSRRVANYPAHDLARFHAQLRNILTEHYPLLGIVAPLAPATPVAVVDTAPARTELARPAQRILLDAAARRQELAAQWLSAAEVSTRLGSQATSGSDRASQLRRAGQLLGVYVSHPSPSYRYPTWQFQPNGRPVSQLAKILAVLRDFGPFEREPDGLRRTTGWGEVEWFLSAHALLDGGTPAEALAIHPGRVLQAARTEFEDEA